jgi:tRNA G18 (ribose-2'-O)-methylase SpoU
MPVIPIDDAGDPRVALYRGVTDAALLRGHGLFVAEGRLVVRRLLSESPLEPVSLLVTGHAHAALADALATRPALPVLVAPQSVLNEIAGFNIHRGCLALGRRPRAPDWRALVGGADAPPRIVVLEAVSNADNVGGIFRSAAALGAGAILLAPGCCDPLYRKAIRTSIGASVVVPYAEVASPREAADALRAAGYVVLALTPDPRATPIAEAAATIAVEARVALVAGAEGEGLTEEALAAADVRVRIPMAGGVDSLNVNVAVGIALHSLTRAVGRDDSSIVVRSS